VIGTHIRLNDSLNEVIEKATRINVPIFQTFLINSRGKRISVKPEEIKNFAQQQSNFDAIFVHASYWVNLSSKESHGMRALEKELSLALQLGLNQIIIHPGAAVGFATKEKGIEILTQRLNKIIKKHPNVIVLLENTTHAKNCIGSDVKDFASVLDKIDQPENIQICIDTSHAYGYGYDISTNEGQELFLRELDNAVGLNKVGLIHLNDTSEELGNKIDRHAVPGTGNIGDEALKKFINRDILKNIPIILELPVTQEQEEIDTIEKIKRWRNYE